MKEIDEKKAIDLFLKADGHNWDEGHKTLLKILKDSNCDLGTVSMIYWRGQPEYYLSYQSESEVPTVNREGWRFIHTVEQRLLSGEYPSLIRFDPRTEGAGQSENDGFVRELPVQVYEKTPGTIEASDILAGLYGPGALNAAAKLNDIAKLATVLQEVGDPNFKHRAATPLMTATINHSIEAIQYLLQHGADINFKNRDSERALHRARHVQVATLLLDNGATLDAKAYWGRTPMHFAAGNIWNNYEDGVVQLFVDRGAKPNLRDRNGETALTWAAANGQFKNFRILIKGGWSIDNLDKEGRNLLHSAVRFPGWNHIQRVNREPIIAELLKLGISPDDRDKAGISARALAEENAKREYLGPLEKDQILELLKISI